MSQVNEPKQAQQPAKAAATGELASDTEGLAEFEDNRFSTSAQLKLADAIATSPPMVRQRKSVQGIFGEAAQLEGEADLPQAAPLQGKFGVVQRDIAAGSEETKPGVAYDKPQQSTDSFTKVYIQAWQAQDELIKKTQSVASATKGKATFPPGLKNPETAMEKIKKEYNGNVSSVVDLVRSTIVYVDVPELLAAMPTIQKEFTIVRLKNKFMNPAPGGYRDINMNIQFKNGHIGELQLSIDQILALKHDQHKLYEEVRKLPADRSTWDPAEKDKLEKLEGDFEKQYEEAMAKSGPENAEKIKGIKEIGVKKK